MYIGRGPLQLFSWTRLSSVHLLFLMRALGSTPIPHLNLYLFGHCDILMLLQSHVLNVQVSNFTLTFDAYCPLAVELSEHNLYVVFLLNCLHNSYLLTVAFCIHTYIHVRTYVNTCYMYIHTYTYMVSFRNPFDVVLGVTCDPYIGMDWGRLTTCERRDSL